jgi:hypothetical protein
MHILAERAVKRAIAAGAAVDPVQHFDLIVELDRLARALGESPVSDSIAILDRSIVVGGSTLRRLSFAARAWLEDCAETWFGKDDPCMFDLCCAWAFAHGRSRAALDACGSAADARQTVRAWLKTLDCTPEQLAAAVEALGAPLAPPTVLLADPVDPAAPARSARIGPVFARLIREYGQTLDYWMFEVSDDAVGVLIDTIARSDEADAKAAKAPPEDWMPGVRAFKAWNAGLKRFMVKVGQTE